MNNEDPWISFIKLEHDRIVYKYNDTIAPDIKKVFLKNRHAIDQHTAQYLKTNETRRDQVIKFDQMVEKSMNDVKKTAETFVFRAKIILNWNTKKPIWHRHRILPYVEAIPTMFSWVPVQRNIVVDDEPVLRNIPYVGDSLSKADDEFVSELVENYEGRVHGGIGGYMNDVILVDLIQSVFKFYRQHGGELQRQSQSSGTAGGSGSEMIVFEKISECFPDKGSSYEIKEKYRILTRGNPTHVPAPNIDEANQPITSSSQPNTDQTMHSYHALLCQRCKIYDCLLHKCKQPPPRIVREPLQASYHDPNRTPCSHECYLARDGSQDVRHSSPQSEIKTRLKRKSTGDVSVWSYGEVAVYKMFRDVLEYNSCLLAKPIQTKTCRQIYEYMKNDPEAIAAISKMKPWSVRAAESGESGINGSSVGGENHSGPNRPANWSRRSKKQRARQTHFLAYKLHDAAAAAAAEEDSDESETEPTVAGTKKRKHSKKRAKSRGGHGEEGGDSTRKLNPYNPCDHPGVECNERCKCVRAGNFCEKYCNCSSECINRFRGCQCRSQCNTKSCPCYLAVRECDPDLCTSCGAAANTNNSGQAVNGGGNHHHHHHHHHSNVGSCVNVAIQRGLRKHLLLAPSEVAGWGIYLKDKTFKNEFIAEYCGEIISQEEAERRGKVYDRLKCSFLFNLNNDYVVDAKRKGNKIRFANHSVNPNCYARVMMVNGDHRIGIFAKRDIEAGEELFFDYSYGPTEQLKFVGIEKPDLRVF